MGIDMGANKADRKLADEIFEGVSEIGKRSEEILNMSQKLSQVLLGTSQAIPPKPALEKTPNTPGFLRETIALTKNYNEILEVSMNNLTAVLKQL